MEKVIEKDFKILFLHRSTQTAFSRARKVNDLTYMKSGVGCEIQRATWLVILSNYTACDHVLWKVLKFFHSWLLFLRYKKSDPLDIVDQLEWFLSTIDSLPLFFFSKKRLLLSLLQPNHLIFKVYHCIPLRLGKNLWYLFWRCHDFLLKFCARVC